MKKLFVFSVSVLLSAILYAGEPFATYSFQSVSVTELEANTIAGDITLTGDADETTTVQVFISGNNQTAEQIKQMLDEYYTIDIRVVNGKLFAVVKQKTQFRRQRGLNISFVISAPKHVSGKMNSASGSIRLSETSGDLSFNTASGSLTVERVSGKISGNTASGNINLTNSADNVSLNTASGNVLANGCTGNIRLNTASGSVRANDLEGNINLNTASGSVTADDIIGSLKAGSASGRIELKNISGNLQINDNSRGNISVNMKTVDEYVIIANNSRSINLTLPAEKGYDLNVTAESVEVSGMRGFRGEMDRKILNGTVGSGGAKIEISKSRQVNLTFN